MTEKCANSKRMNATYVFTKVLGLMGNEMETPTRVLARMKTDGGEEIRYEEG